MTPVGTDGSPEPSEQAPEGSDQAPGLTVAAVARRLGVAPATLRTWARRYGLGPSSHQAGSHRRYSADDLARLVVMRSLTLEGVPPVDAARAAMAGPEAPGADAGGRAPGVEEVVATVTRLSRSVAAANVRPVPRSRAAGRTAEPPWGQELDRAALALDPEAAARLVAAAFGEHGVIAGWDGLISPALRALSQRWETTGPGVDTAHLLTGAVLDALRQRPAPEPRTTGLVLLAGAEDEREGLALHVLAAALSDGGVPSRVLALGLPPEALAAAVRSTGPAAVLVHATRAVRDASQIAELPRLRPAGRLVLSGPGWRSVELPEGIAPQLVLTLQEACAALTARALA